MGKIEANFISKLLRYFKYNLYVQFSNFISYLIYPFVKFLHFQQNRVTVFLYHNVSNDAPQNCAPYMNVTPDNFAKQLDALIAISSEILTAQEFIDFLQRRLTLKNGGVLLTFDDGFRGLVDNALFLLKQKHIPACIFVTTRFLNKEEPFPFFKNLIFPDRLEYPPSWLPLTTDHIKSHADIVWGGHGASHGKLGRMSMEEARGEMRECREMLTEAGAGPPYLFAYPQGIAEHGDWNALTNQMLAEEGFALAFTSHAGRVKAGDNPFALRRMAVYSWDTPEIIRRKISGAYDWQYWLQKLLHRLVPSR